MLSASIKTAHDWHTDGVSHFNQQQLGSAKHCFENALRNNKNHTNSMQMLALTCLLLGEYKESIEYYHQLKQKTALAEGDACNLGSAYIYTEQYSLAADLLSEVYQQNPDCAPARDNLLYLYQKGKLEDPLCVLRLLIARQQDHLPTIKAYNEVLAAAGHQSEQLTFLKAACERLPQNPDVHALMGYYYFNQRKYEKTLAHYTQTVTLAPDNANAHFYLALALERCGKHSQALASFDTALKLDPTHQDAHIFKAGCLMNIGKHTAALTLLSSELIAANNLYARSLRIFALSYMPDSTMQQLYDEARQYAAIVESKCTAFTSWPWLTHATTFNNLRPLTIGFVSPDLITHPVGAFLENMLQELAKRSNVRLHAYALNNAEDALTQRIKPLFAHWQAFVPQHSDQHIANCIYNDKVDVLFDLAGYSSRHRISLFAYKPSPVQINWLGYYASTGLSAMDYIMGDPITTPPALQPYLSERILPLPATRFCFSPNPNAPAPASAPHLTNGFITFGCYQSVKKISAPTLALWASILQALPTAKLRIQANEINHADILHNLQHKFVQAQIDISRIEWVSGMSYLDYLESHKYVDILLDTSPFTGGTTTAESLWMGVPTITLLGDTMIARQGASILTAAGLPFCVAGSATEYIDKAIALANDSNQLLQLRHNLRQQLLNTPLYNQKNFVDHWLAAVNAAVTSKKQAGLSSP